MSITELAYQQVMVLMAAPHGSIEGWDKRRRWGLCAGVLADLAVAGRISLSVAGGRAGIEVLDPTSTGDEVMDRVLRLLGSDRLTLSRLVKERGKDVEAAVVEAAAGTIMVKRGSILGLFPTVYRVEPERMRAEVAAALISEPSDGEADRRAAATLAILDGLGVLGHALPELRESLGLSGTKDRLSQVEAQMPLYADLRRMVRGIGSGMPTIAASM